jgi:hypothetical protein
LLAVSAAVAVLACAPQASAAQVDALIEKLVEKKILTRIEAETLRADVASAEKKTFKQFVQETNPWLEGLTSKGDIRLRYEAFGLEDEDGRDRERGRFRLRWGLEKKFNDAFKAGFRVASGPTDEATSTNQSFDNEFNAKNFNIDRVYGIFNAQPTLKEAFPAVKTAEIGAGKVANPYEKWGTSIVWDGDVNPEGGYERLDVNLASWEGGFWDLNTAFGQFVLDEQSTREDVQLLAYGIGTTYEWAKKENIFLNFVYYDWTDYENITNLEQSYTSALAGNPNGNDDSIDGFKVVSLYGELNTFAPVPMLGTQPIKFFGHYIMNTAAEDTVALTANQDLDEGWSAGIKLGSSKKQGEWETKYQWYRIEPNATPGNFAESDIGLGFANNQGHQLSWAYRLTDAIQLALTYWDVERIAQLTSSSDHDAHVSRWQADIIYSF